MAENRILVVGSLNMDQILHVPRLPLLGETLLGGGSLRLVPGGKGANQAVAMARLGASVAIAGRIGNDSFGKELLEALHEDEIDTSLLRRDREHASGVACIFLTPDGENAIVVASGANMQVGRDRTQMDAILQAIPRVRALVLQLEIPVETIVELVAAAHRVGIPVVLNLAPAQVLPQETISSLDVLIVNETEASLLSGQPVASSEDARSVAALLQQRGPAIVIMTLGGQGAILATKDEKGQTRILAQSAPAVEVVDTTAAGDCFVAAFTVGWLEQQTLEDALRFAVFASALKVTRLGAQSGLPFREDVEAFQKQA